MTRTQRYWLVGLIAAFVLAAVLAGVAGWLMLRGTLSPEGLLGRLTQEEVQQTVVTTLQREAPASFLVTGTVDLSATVQIRNTETILGYAVPGSETTTRVRMPGRASYGFDVRQLDTSHVEVRDDGLVLIRLPELSLFSVEPQLGGMEVETETGWLRLDDGAQRVERATIQATQRALREQAEEHLGASAQPQVNTARAVEAMLRPVLRGAGILDPRFRIVLGEGLVLEPEG